MAAELDSNSHNCKSSPICCFAIWATTFTRTNLHFPPIEHQGPFPWVIVLNIVCNKCNKQNTFFCPKSLFFSQNCQKSIFQWQIRFCLNVATVGQEAEQFFHLSQCRALVALQSTWATCSTTNCSLFHFSVDVCVDCLQQLGVYLNVVGKT